MTTAPNHVSSVAAALRAVEVLLPTRYEWLGDVFDVPEPVSRHGAPQAVRGALVEAILWRLYASYFTMGEAAPAVRHFSTSPRGLSHELSAANAGTGCVDPGWRLVGRDHRRWFVQRGDLRLWPSPDELVAEGPGVPRDGQLVSIRLPKEAPEMSPGFYMALGDRGFSADIPRKLDRFYLNLREEGAVAFIGLVTRLLNGMGLAFRAKVVDEPGAFGRCDSALLVFERRDRDQALAAALAVHEELANFIDPETPALTRRLAHGLAFAEDPGPEESFGIQRCRLIAEAVVAAHECGTRDLEGRLALVHAHFARAGTSLRTPYLGTHSPGDLDDDAGLAAGLAEEPTAC